LLFRRAAVLESEGIGRLQDLVLLAFLPLERRCRGLEPTGQGTICTEITADRVSQRDFNGCYDSHQVNVEVRRLFVEL